MRLPRPETGQGIGCGGPVTFRQDRTGRQRVQPVEERSDVHVGFLYQCRQPIQLRFRAPRRMMIRIPMARDERQPPIEGIASRGGRPGPAETLPESTPAVRRREERAPREGATEAPARPDQFRQAGRLERFIRTIAERVEHGWLYQTFRLPGSRRVVHDRRESPQEGAGQASDRLGTSFERAVVARFEQGREQAQTSPDGRPHFLQKTAAQWKAFFLQFLHRTEKKRVPLDAVGDTMTFRGLFKKGSDPATGVVIGDLPLTNGTLEKFARFDIRLQTAVSGMAELPPGAAVSKDMVAQGIDGTELEYFAIGSPTGEATMVVAARATQGVFTNLRTEAEIARQLGLVGPERGPPSEGGGAGERVTPRAWWAKWFREREEGPEAPADRFVPWWRWDREARVGARWWFTAVTLAAILALLAIGFWTLFRAL